MKMIADELKRRRAEEENCTRELKLKNRQLKLKVQQMKLKEREGKAKDKQIRAQAKDLKKLQQALDTQKKLRTKEHKQRNDLLQKLRRANKFSVKERNRLVEAALQPYYTKPQLDRMLYGKFTHWTAEDYSNATVLLGLGTKSYRYFRINMKYPLPAVSCVRAHVAKIAAEEGLLKPVLNLMAARGRTMTELQKQTVVTFDEVHISTEVCFDRADDRALGPHKKTQVIMTRGLFAPWKNPLYYAFDTNVTEQLIDEVLTALHEAGFSVVAITSDMGGDNRNLCKAMDIDEKVTYFLHPVTARRVFCFADVPHLLKLARNHLFDDRILLNAKQKNANLWLVAGKEPLTDLLKLQNRVELEAHKMHWPHMQCAGFERQKVNLAVQVLSNSTANCLEKAEEAGHISAGKLKVTLLHKMLFKYVEI